MRKYEFQGPAVEVTVNRKEENSEDFCLNFVQEFSLWSGKIIQNQKTSAKRNQIFYLPPMANGVNFRRRLDHFLPSLGPPIVQKNISLSHSSLSAGRIQNSQLCSAKKPVLVVVLVISAPNHVAERRAIRYPVF